MELKALIESLRGIADFYEAHPDFPMPFYSGEVRAHSACTPEHAKQQVAAFLDGAGHVDKKTEDDEDNIKLIRFPNGFKFVFCVGKKTLGCRKVAHKRTVTEEKWECGPVLDAIAEVKEGQ